MLVVGERNKKQRVLEYLFSMYTSKFFNVGDPLSGLKAINLKKLDLKLIILPSVIQERTFCCNV